MPMSRLNTTGAKQTASDPIMNHETPMAFVASTAPSVKETIPAGWEAAVADVIGFYSALQLRPVRGRPTRDRDINPHTRAFVLGALPLALEYLRSEGLCLTAACLCRHEALICVLTVKRIALTGEPYESTAHEWLSKLDAYLKERS
jgi:hypothetical protein